MNEESIRAGDVGNEERGKRKKVANRGKKHSGVRALLIRSTHNRAHDSIPQWVKKLFRQEY